MGIHLTDDKSTEKEKLIIFKKLIIINNYKYVGKTSSREQSGLIVQKIFWEK